MQALERHDYGGVGGDEFGDDGGGLGHGEERMRK